MATTTKVREVRTVPQKSADGKLWSLLVTTCPWCFGSHLHGAGIVANSPQHPDDEYYGVRLAHCDTGGGSDPKEYCLVPKEKLTVGLSTSAK